MLLVYVKIIKLKYIRLFRKKKLKKRIYKLSLVQLSNYGK